MGTCKRFEQRGKELSKNDIIIWTLFATVDGTRIYPQLLQMLHQHLSRGGLGDWLQTKVASVGHDKKSSWKGNHQKSPWHEVALHILFTTVHLISLSAHKHYFPCRGRGFSQRPVLSSTQQFLGYILGWRMIRMFEVFPEMPENNSKLLAFELCLTRAQVFARPALLLWWHPSATRIHSPGLGGNYRGQSSAVRIFAPRNMNPQLGRIFRQKFPPRQGVVDPFRIEVPITALILGHLDAAGISDLELLHPPPKETLFFFRQTFVGPGRELWVAPWRTCWDLWECWQVGISSCWVSSCVSLQTRYWTPNARWLGCWCPCADLKK